MSLFKKMKVSLPIHAYPAQELINSNDQFNRHIISGFEIIDLFDGGHIGGIICTIQFGAEILKVSLTYLNVDSTHPLKEKIDEYKKNRIAVLNMEHPVPIRYNKTEKKNLHPSRDVKKCKKCFG